MLIAGCGETELKQEDIVCVYDKYENTTLDVSAVIGKTKPTSESVFSCTNKTGEAVSGMIEVDKDNGKEIRKLYIKDGLVTKYEQETKVEKANGIKLVKEEIIFENGKFVKKIYDGEEDSSAKPVAALWAINGVLSSKSFIDKDKISVKE